jgi:hypothetical protein
MDKSGVTGQAMKETQHINKSLSSLGDVMEGLDKKSKHIPYRNSKLTYLLQDSLGGNSKTMMIVTVCPTELTADETLFALQVCLKDLLLFYLTSSLNIVRNPSTEYSTWSSEEKHVLEDPGGIVEGCESRTQSREAKISTLIRDHQWSANQFLLAMKGLHSPFLHRDEA